MSQWSLGAIGSTSRFPASSMSEKVQSPGIAPRRKARVPPAFTAIVLRVFTSSRTGTGDPASCRRSGSNPTARISSPGVAP